MSRSRAVDNRPLQLPSNRARRCVLTDLTTTVIARIAFLDELVNTLGKSFSNTAVLRLLVLAVGVVRVPATREERDSVDTLILVPHGGHRTDVDVTNTVIINTVEKRQRIVGKQCLTLLIGHVHAERSDTAALFTRVTTSPGDLSEQSRHQRDKLESRRSSLSHGLLHWLNGNKHKTDIESSQKFNKLTMNKYLGWITHLTIDFQSKPSSTQSE